MKKIILAATVLINLSFTKPNYVLNHHDYANIVEQKTENNKRANVVYICTGPKAYAYHSNSRCCGLNNCSAQINSINLSDAINKGRRACQRCY